MIAVTVALSGVLVGTSVVSASVPIEFNELQTWHTSGMTEGTLNVQTLKGDSATVDSVQKESTAVVNPSESITNDVVTPSESVVETTPEYVATPIVEAMPEYVPTVGATVPPTATPESEVVAPSQPVNPPVNEGSGWTPPTSEELEDIFGGIDMENPLWCYDYETGNDYYCVYE